MKADIAFEDADTRCPTCHKRHQIDIGADLFGVGGGVVFCPHCGPTPQCSDWESSIRAAVAAVLGRGAAS